jgi:LmbE family N-acetylglucosaminyl deacetylase
MEWIYLSPHCDDVALSCGGLLWEQSQAGERVRVWTLCAGDIPAGPLSSFAESLHQRWESGEGAMALRRAEDQHACQLLGAETRYFDLPDCIYRRDKPGGEHLYTSEEDLFGPLNPAEEKLIENLSAELGNRLPIEAQVVAPLALGGHVDHRLVRAAAEQIKMPLWFYADFPYIERAGEQVWIELSQREHTDFPVSEAGLAAWVAGIMAHGSQISTFWPDLQAMQTAIKAYHQRVCGVRLFRG